MLSLLSPIVEKMLSYFGSLSVSVCRSNLVELFGLMTCGVRGIGQEAKLLAGYRIGKSSATKVQTGARCRSDRAGSATADKT